MAQNTLLPVNLSKKNSSYKLSTDIVNLNKTNAISFGSIGDWKKWMDKNPLHKSIWQLQVYTALGTAAAAISRNLGLVTSSIISGCQSSKDASCDNYKDYELKKDLDISKAANCLISAIVEASIEVAKAKSNTDATTVGTSTAIATGNAIIGILAGLGVKFAQDAKAKAITAATIIEAYGGAVIYYLENRRNNKDDGSGGSGSGSGSGGDGGNQGNGGNGNNPFNNKNPLHKLGYMIENGQLEQVFQDIGFHLFTIIDSAIDSSLNLDTNKPESVKNFFEDLDMEKLKRFHRHYEHYMLFYFPQNLDIKETYSLEIDKKTNKLYVYDKIDNEIMCSIDNIPLEVETPKQTVEESTHTQTYSTPSYSYNYNYNYNSNRYNRNDGLIGGMLC